MTNLSSVDDKKTPSRQSSVFFAYLYNRDLGIIAVGLGVVCLTL